MNKIIVIGSPGAGKSTFARALAVKTGLPLFYLDMIFHRPDKTTVLPEAFDKKLGEIIKQPQWIIDGNYLRTLPLRFEHCERVFFFDMPVDVCLEGAAARVGTVREDLPWVETEFDADFRQYIIDFPKDQLPVIYRLIDQYKDTRRIVIFRSRAEANAYLEKGV
ncbi:MAG: adenylate kinase [Lachnospiraceae bacterium]|nr:adenylate kinase [Lachnospiraceae bacterium]